MDEEGRKILNLFFERRFKKKPESDKHYYNEWLERFQGGSPFRYMDFESRRIWLQVLKERINAYGGTGKKLKKVV
jgi:hypothetical protein